MYWCSSVLGNHGKDLEWEKLIGILKPEKAIYQFFQIPSGKKLADPSWDRQELLVDNWSIMGRKF